MSTSITSHNVVSETIQMSAQRYDGTEWIQLKWRNNDGFRSSVTFILADNDARSALEQLAREILSATAELETDREEETK